MVADPETDDKATAPPRVLFVDDEINVLQALKRQLKRRQSDWSLAFESSPAEALAQVQRAPPDVVVSDLSMPGMNGLDLVRAMRDAAPETRFIMLTGTADLQSAADAINVLRVFRFYTKPCPADVLIEGIEAALADARPDLSPLPDAQVPRITESLGAAVLNQLAIGVLVVDRKGHLVFANRRGSLILAGADGLFLAPDGTCRASDRRENQRLRGLIDDTISQAGETEEDTGIIALSRRNEQRAYTVLVVPLSVPGSAPLSALFVTDPADVQLPSQENLSDLYDLSRAEAGLVYELARGERLEAAAKAVGVTLSTARTYLKSVFSKTDTNRQSDLIKLVLCSAPAVGR